MKIVCECGNEEILNTIDPDTGEQTRITEMEGQYCTVRQFEFWGTHYQVGIVCSKCGKALWLFK